MATGGGSRKTDASGNSTFYENAFEDNFNPTLTDTQSHGAVARTDSNEKQNKPMTALATSSAVKSNSRPSTPIHCAQPSPLTCYALRLKHGDELRKSLLNFCEKNELKAAFILTCVGSALSAKLRLASAVANSEGNYMLDMTNGTEIVSLQGTLSNGGHLHASLADVTGKVIGGHLLELVVDTTVEVVIGECTNLSFTRVFDQSTGFNELVVNSR